MAYTHNGTIRLHYEVEGNGPPLLLHHGLADSLQGWRDFGWAASLRQDYQLILMDARGHGRSDKPRSPEAYTLAQRVGDILAVVDAVGVERVHYLGYSLGGWLGFGLARFSPQVLHSLVLLGAHPYAENMGYFRQAIGDGLDVWLGRLEKMGLTLDEKTKERILANDLPALQASVTDDRQDLSDVLPTTFIPALLIAGSMDPRRDPARRAAKALPQGEFLCLPERNHFETIQQADIVLPHIERFLRRVTQDNVHHFSP